MSINGEIMPDALYEDIPDGAEIHFLPTLVGRLTNYPWRRWIRGEPAPRGGWP